MTDLDGRGVMLSASIPWGDRGEDVRPFDPAAITDAVTAVGRAVLTAGGRLIFGGHPTITPLLLWVAAEQQTLNRILVFQSEWYRPQLTAETRRLVELGFGTVRWVPASETQAASERSLRLSLSEETTLIGAVFVGGMSGVREEFQTFHHLRPTLPRIPISGPGGAAARLTRGEMNISAGLRHSLASHRYPFLAAEIVQELAQGG